MTQRPEYTWQNKQFAAAEDLPVVLVSTQDAEAFCNWLSKKDGRTYRLPSEMEWEYACRAGTTSLWYTGNDPKTILDAEWTAQNSMRKLRPGGGKSANPFGLFDMLGNAEELCQALPAGAVVFRGAHIRESIWRGRSASRFEFEGKKERPYFVRGFRVVLAGDLPPRDAGWRPLLNGKDLTGWKAFGIDKTADPDKAWQVVDGVLRCTGDPQGYLYTTGSHENYELTFEWQAPKKQAGQNECLLYLHGQAATENLPQALGVNLFEDSKVILYQSNPKQFKNALTIDPDPKAKSKDGWKKVRIRCEKDLIEIEINGNVRYHGAGAPWQRGFIAFRSVLQALDIRNLQIRNLPTKRP